MAGREFNSERTYMSSILCVCTVRQTNVVVLSRVALKRLTILVVSLESGTKLIDGGASVAVWRMNVRREIGCEEAKPKQLPESVRRLSTHVQVSNTAGFPSKLLSCPIKRWLVRRRVERCGSDAGLHCRHVEIGTCLQITVLVCITYLYCLLT
jgi:hypothetical protein